ncbi:hypothetical protein JCM3770_001717 [Rhodotorula araucariae]
MAAAALPTGLGAHTFASTPSAAASPSSPAFPSHLQSSALNGAGINLALRPGTAFGTSHLASPPATSVPSFASSDRVDYATLPGWDDTAVGLWLAAALPTLPTQTYADIFAANDIRGAVLLEVDQSALKEMGIRSVGDRVKICVAIRALRAKYLVATQLHPSGTGGLSRRPSAMGRLAPSTAKPASRPSSPHVPTAPATATPALHPNARAGSLSYSARSISVGNRIPPPLHLAQSNSMPSPSLLQQRSPPSRTTSPRSVALHLPASASATLSAARQVPPPSHPPPTTRIPAPPHAAPSPTNWLGEISGLPPQPPPSTGLSSSASTSSLSTRAGPPYSSPSGHRKASSSSFVGAAPRPAQQPSPYAGHPYGGGAGLLPSAMAVERSLPAPARSQTTPAAATPAAPLSNLEVMRKAVRFTSADGVTTRVLAVADAKDGREVLARVMKKFGGKEGEDVDGWGVWVTENTGAARLLTEHELYTICQKASAPERVRGLIVRRHHTLPPGASSSLLSTSPPALASFSQPSSPTPGSSSFPSSSAALADKRGRKLQWVFGESHAAVAESSRPGGTIPYSSAGATGGSGSPTSPNYLGVEIPRMGIEPASPSTSGDESDEVLIIQAQASSPGRTGKTKMNRASTVSVMSGLEAPDWARDFYGAGEQDLEAERTSQAPGQASERGAAHYHPSAVYSPPQRTSSRRTPPGQQTTASLPQRGRSNEVAPTPAQQPAAPDSPPSTWRERHGSLLPDSTRKLRNFFGQRPPSELITNHLTEFFPLGGGAGGAGKAERHRLSKQVRASIRKSMSAAAGGTLLPSSGRGDRRYSAASVASRASRASSTRSTEPRAAVSKGTSWEHQASRPSLDSVRSGVGESAHMSRFSGSSNGSTTELLVADPAGGAVPFPSSGGGGPPSIKGNRSPRSSSGSALDPPNEADEEAAEGDSPGSSVMALNSSTSSSTSTSTTGDHADTRSLASSLAPSYLDAGGRPAQRLSRRMSRLSGSSRLSVGAQSLWERRSRDSDAASVITVDEVTAELETRRASGVSWRAGGAGVEGSDDEGSDAGESDIEDDLSDEEDSSEEDVEEEDVEEVEPGTAKPQGMKWIKGALIGAGSFGSVYLGMNPIMGSLMAVKQVELPTGNSHNEERKKSMLEALEREIELLKVLQHENIVQYLDSSTDDKHLNIFLEYVPGGSVAALLQNYGAFEEALVSKFVRQILTGLDYLHEREIIHRDIKGANILVDNKGNIKISDFGISKKVEDNLLTGAKVHRPSLQGSVYWMAPEVVKQTAYTSKADIWSLGCLVVEMLTGAHPWANLTQMQAIFRIGSSSRPTVPDDISADADDFLEQTFEIEHTDRPSAKELLQHTFIRDPEAWAASQQTPTRATFSQQTGAVGASAKEAGAAGGA